MTAYHILRFHTVEHIVGNGKGDFSLHAVGLSQLAYLINVVFVLSYRIESLNHDQ